MLVTSKVKMKRKAEEFYKNYAMMLVKHLVFSPIFGMLVISLFGIIVVFYIGVKLGPMIKPALCTAQQCHKSNFLMTDRRPWCGQPARMEFVRGHYECSTCRRPIMDCCDGEQACPVEASEAAQQKAGSQPEQLALGLVIA